MLRKLLTDRNHPEAPGCCATPLLSCALSSARGDERIVRPDPSNFRRTINAILVSSLHGHVFSICIHNVAFEIRFQMSCGNVDTIWLQKAHSYRAADLNTHISLTSDNPLCSNYGLTAWPKQDLRQHL